MEKPLISIMIPAFNDAKTLSRCLQSVLEQDYENLMVAVMDNHSEDETYDILMDFERQYRDRLYTGRMHHPVSPHEHHSRCRSLISPRTRFLQYFPPTDVMSPTCISRCQTMFESSKKVGCVLVHADVIHPSGARDSASKYRPTDGVIPGDIQMAYFMAQGMELNVTSLYRIEFYDLSSHEGYLFNRFPAWLPLVMVSSISDIAYISDTLTWRGNPRAIQGDRFIFSLEDLFEHYLFLQAFNTIADRLGRQAVCDHYPKAVERLALECIHCSGLLLKHGDDQAAKAYLSLSLAFLPEIAATQEFRQLAALFEHQPVDWR